MMLKRFNLNLRKATARVILLPLLFSLLGYGILYLALKPIITPVIAIGSLIISDPNANPQLINSGTFEDKDIFEGQTVPLSEVVIPTIGTHYAQLRIESIDLDVKLYWGDTDELLDKGAGQYTGSFMPGFRKPILIAGHNLTHFNSFQYLEVGSTVEIQTNYGLYVYEITELSIHRYDEDEAFPLDGEEELLMLYTCYPFHILATRKDDRFVVYAKRISGPDIR